MTTTTPPAIAPGPIRILHLSDLHFTAATPSTARLRWLIEDLVRGDDVPRGAFDYLVVSGDFTDRGNEAGYGPAVEFINGLLAHLGLKPDRCILVPGNHDVAEPDDAYVRTRDVSGLAVGTWVQQGAVTLKRSETGYPTRFEPFSRCLFEPVMGHPYPLAFAEQGLVQSFFEGGCGLQFLSLNSCWELDEFDRKRSSVLPTAVAAALTTLDNQEKQARVDGDLSPNDPVFQIGVWHHAVTGRDAMKDTVFVDTLRQRGVKIGLHGDIHELRTDLVGRHQLHQMEIVGVGSFGSPHDGLPEATPRHYNLIEIARDFHTVIVHTRQQRRPDGPWEGWYAWPNAPGAPGKLPYYTIEFNPGAPPKPATVAPPDPR